MNLNNIRGLNTKEGKLNISKFILREKKKCPETRVSSKDESDFKWEEEGRGKYLDLEQGRAAPRFEFSWGYKFRTGKQSPMRS